MCFNGPVIRHPQRHGLSVLNIGCFLSLVLEDNVGDEVAALERSYARRFYSRWTAIPGNPTQCCYHTGIGGEIRNVPKA